MPERAIGATAARALMDFAVSRGASRALLVERSGIDTLDLLDEEGRVPLDRYAALMKAGQALCGDPAFALHFGESEYGAERTLACMLGVLSPTVAEGFAQVVRDPRAGGANAGRYELVHDAEGIWIADPTHHDFPEGAEASYARCVTMARRVFPGSHFLKAVHFRHAEPRDRTEYERIFQMPVVFGSARNAVLLDPAVLQQMPRAASHVLDIVRTRADAVLESTPMQSTRCRVEALLANGLRSADVSVDAIARELGMGRHTLFRKLRAEGVTFKQIVNELRHRLAVQYLRERKLAVSETAYLLGFSDPAAFSRAYKRWTGRPPGQRS